MLMIKTVLALTAIAAPVLAYEPVTCTTKNATQNIVTSITDADNFCTMLTGYGVDPVAPNEGCGSVYCHGAASKLGPPMPKGYILSSNYAKNESAGYIQVTGCIDSSVWGQNPMDEGGQMDSHGWPYSCQGYKKFVSLLEPATNTFCLRCCMDATNRDCNTSISTKGCWNVVPGTYAMADGSACKAPAGGNGTVTPSGGVVPSATGSGVVPGASGSPSSGAGASGTDAAGSKTTAAGSTSGAVAGSRVEMMGAMAAVAMAALAAAL